MVWVSLGQFYLGFSYQALEKLKRQLADADAAIEARKKPPEDTGPRIIGEGLVIDEWVSLSSFYHNFQLYKIVLHYR